MRFKYILILLLGCCCWRCNSIDDRFEEKDNLRLIMLEAIEEPYANPKDVYVYKLMAQRTPGTARQTRWCGRTSPPCRIPRL